MWALVTGGAKRIGKSIVEELQQAGFKVVVHCNNSRLEAEALSPYVAQGDLSNINNAAGIIEDAQKFGDISLLVNNASLFEKDDFSCFEKTFDQHMNVNLRSPLLLAQKFTQNAPVNANIINIIDQRVLKPTPQFFSYSLSKEALWSATKMMAQSLAPLVRVNAIAPGPTMKNERQEEEDFMMQYKNILLEHPSFSKDIAKAVVFLAQNSSITGQLLCVDSGQHLSWKTPDVWGIEE